jgi:short-subunit dehydrogenase
VLNSKTVKTHQPIGVVTGANSGIGKEIALGLAQSGVHVVMVCRDINRGEAALQDIKTATQSNSIDLLIADLSSQSDIRRLAQTIHDNYSSLDLLINNAGFFLPQRAESVDGIEMTLVSQSLRPIQMVVEYYLERQTNQVESNAYGCFAG